MSKRGYLTPDAPTGSTCRRVLIPDTLVYAFNGAVGELGDLWNWEKFDGLEPDEAAILGHDIYLSMVDCEVDSTMLGSIQFYAGVLPDGVLLCDGSLYTQLDYPDLYASLAGVGGDFNVPDLRGKFLMGESVSYPLGTVGGVVEHTITVGEMPAHTHQSENSLPDIDLEGAGVPLPAAGVSFPAPTGLTGGGLPHENLPPYHVLKPGIVALPVVLTGGGGAAVEVGVVVDQRVQGQNGGTFTSGAWRTRVLNAVRVTASWLSLAGNEFTLSDGQYLVMASAPVRGVQKHRARILRVSDNAVFGGQSTRDNPSSLVNAGLSVVGSEDFRLEHRCTNTNTGDGFGQALGSGVETYSQVVIIKYA